MFLKEFNQTPAKKILKLNKLLSEEFGIKIKAGFPSKKNLQKVAESAELALVQIKGSNRKFHLDPDYAKFLGVKEVVNTMISEGMYAESPAYESMCNEMRETVNRLMDSGYTMDEAASECMNRYRMDPRWAYDDEFVMPIVLKAAKDYMSECGMQREEVEGAVMEMPQTDLNERLLRELAAECGVELTDTGSIKAIEEKLAMFAEVSGKSRDAVVGFLNGLEEDSVQGGIQMFGRKVAEANKFVAARRDAIKSGKKEFEVDGKKYPVTGDKELEEAKKSKPDYLDLDKDGNKKEPMKKAAKDAKKKNESMFDDLINELLNEQVDVEQAEVVMAVRALADDVQDQIERLGRMVNEDVPAIADQMRAEMGADAAQSFVEQMNQTLVGHLEATRAVKASMDSQIAGLTGEQQTDVSAGLGGADMGAEMPAAEPAAPAVGGEEMPADNIAATAGPEEAPLGRAEV